jgi:CO/xanthine dehydrogenase FAD-binding subunit
VTPSDLATTFSALGAVAHVCGADGERDIAVLDLYNGPGETVLRGGDLISAIHVPTAVRARVNRFEKLALRAGDFAIATAATSLEVRAGRIASAVVVLGGVGPVPYRARRTEDLLVGASLTDERAIRASASAWTVDAHPLRMNAWKLEAASALVARAVAG